jgi:hypothetical protein
VSLTGQDESLMERKSGDTDRPLPSNKLPFAGVQLLPFPDMQNQAIGRRVPAHDRSLTEQQIFPADRLVPARNQSLAEIEYQDLILCVVLIKSYPFLGATT